MNCLQKHWVWDLRVTEQSLLYIQKEKNLLTCRYGNNGIIQKEYPARDIMTKDAILNALTVRYGNLVVQQTVCFIYLLLHMKLDLI